MLFQKIKQSEKRREYYLKRKSEKECPLCKKEMSLTATRCVGCLKILRKNGQIIAGNQWKKGHNFFSGSEKGWFKKGHMDFAKNKGRKHNEEIRKKMSEGRKGLKHSEETKRKMSLAKIGKPKSEETKRKMSKSKKGEKNYNWRGGISFEPYTLDWTETLRRSIRERDKYTCQLCEEKQGDKAHSVHHIDYNKKNCCPENLITLCHHCHMKTSFNRNYWINYFNDI